MQKELWPQDGEGLFLVLRIPVIKVLAKDKYFRHDRLLFKENKLCMPNCSMGELLVRKAYESELLRYLGCAQTLDN